jgi:hypothetical protein
VWRGPALSEAEGALAREIPLKKPEPEGPRLSSWLCARIKDKNLALAQPIEMRPKPRLASNRQLASSQELGYALRRGRTVKSRTCARMLDICIPFSCDKYGKTSATN